MNKTDLEKTILNIYEEIKQEKQSELQINESLKPAYQSLMKFLLTKVKKGVFKRTYDIDTNTGRMNFVTKGGKNLVFNDAKIGITIFKTWKGRKDKNFFDYSEHDEILKFALDG